MKQMKRWLVAGTLLLGACTKAPAPAVTAIPAPAAAPAAVAPAPVVPVPAPAAAVAPPAASATPALPPAPTTVAPPVADRWLRISTINEPEFIDPGLATGYYDANYIYNLFEGLVSLAPNGEMAPGVAERWEMAPDQLTYTFHLRANAKWSDGRPVTAQDFAYAWERVLNPATAAQYASIYFYIKNAEAYNTGTLKDPTQLGFRAVDDRTFQVTLAAPTPFFLKVLMHHSFMPVPRWAIEKGGARWTQPEFFVGNGLFAVKAWTPQKEMLVEKNSHYWDAANVHFAGLKLLPVTDTETGLRMFNNDELDAVVQVPESKVAQLMGRPDFLQGPFLQTYYFRLNTTKAPFTDPRVRQAFALAIDRKALGEQYLQKTVHPSATMVPEGMEGYTSPKGLDFDPTRARQLLAQAGFPDGTGLPTITILYNTNERHKLLAEVVQQMWRQNLGANVELVNQEWKTYLKSMANLDYMVARAGWVGDFNDPVTFLGDLFLSNSGNNMTGWKNLLFDELIKRSNQVGDPTTRRVLLQQAEDIVLQDAPTVPVYNELLRMMVRTELKNFPKNLHGLIPLKGVTWGAPTPAQPQAAAPAAPPASSGPNVAAPATIGSVPVSQPNPDGYLRFADGAEPSSLDPALINENGSHNIGMAIYEGLYMPDPKDLHPIPAMAESYTVSPDHLVYRFTLRANAKWSDGRPVTAQDFVYAWQRVVDPKTASDYAFVLMPIKNAAGINGGKITDLSQLGAKAVDDRTLEVTLEYPTAYFLGLLAYPAYFPVPKWAVDAHGDRWTQPGNIVVNGAFTIKSWVAQKEVTVVKNPLYWNAAAVRLPGIHFTHVEDRNTQLKMYEAGELDVAWTLPTERVPPLLGRPDLQIGPFLSTYYYVVNTTRPAFADVRVRQALSLAIDRKVLVEQFLKKVGIPTASMVPPGLPGYTQAKGLEFDPVRAKQLLTEAGYGDPSKFPPIKLHYNTDGTHQMIAQVIQQMWKQNLGIQAELFNQEWKVHLKTKRALEYDVARTGWIGDYIDPTTFLDLYRSTSSQNDSGWKDAQFDQLLLQASNELDSAKRLQFLQQAEARLIEQGSVLPIYAYYNHFLVRPEVKGIYTNLLDTHTYAGVYFDGGPTAAVAPAAAPVPAPVSSVPVTTPASTPVSTAPVTAAPTVGSAVAPVVPAAAPVAAPATPPPAPVAPSAAAAVPTVPAVPATAPVVPAPAGQ